jgi:hypothetical protein
MDFLLRQFSHNQKRNSPLSLANLPAIKMAKVAKIAKIAF